VIVEVERNAGLSRDQLVRVLAAEGVIARRYFYPGCHRWEPYRTLFPDGITSLPQTDLVAERVIALPTGTAVSPEMVENVCALVRFAVENGDEIARRLGPVGPAEAYGDV
jgi:dTDP-4-amino-4,6-dideoxygalactose transaminase